ncbi:MAG: FxLYD domain-containing protein [Patescibacteria group bacterium]|nr:FxLYD domain-containing protein [Patescibacteria group bacterium]
MDNKKQVSREEYIKYQQEQIEKEFDRKRMFLKYQKRFMIAIIIIVVVGVLGTIGFFLYRLFNPIEQPINTQIVDAPPAGFAITTKQVEIIPESANRYDAFLRIIDTDQNWGVAKLDYTISLRSTDKAVVGERTGTTFILPNQEKSIIELGIDTTNKATTATTDFEIKEVQKLTESPALNFATENLAYQVTDDKSKVTGTIVNQTVFGFSEIIINVLVYNEQNNLVGYNFTTVNDLTPNQRRDFTVFWRKNLNVKKPRIVVESYVNPFNSMPFLDIYSQGQMLEY